MSMHNEAERLRVLAEKLDSEPQKYSELWADWYCRDAKRTSLLRIATPGALLGAAVDLLVHKFGPERAAQMLAEAAQGKRSVEEVLAALIAAMEEVI